MLTPSGILPYTSIDKLLSLDETKTFLLKKSEMLVMQGSRGWERKSRPLIWKWQIYRLY